MRRIGYGGHITSLWRGGLGPIQHRCTIAGAKKLPFDSGALEALHEISRGNLRAADGLALTALERAARSKKTVVGAQHVAEARQELYP